MIDTTSGKTSSAPLSDAGSGGPARTELAGRHARPTGPAIATPRQGSRVSCCPRRDLGGRSPSAAPGRSSSGGECPRRRHAPGPPARRTQLRQQRPEILDRMRVVPHQATRPSSRMVCSFSTLPVFSVVFGSNSTTWHSSVSASGKCSVP